MFNVNITTVIPGLGDIISGDSTLYVFSSKPMSTTMRAAVISHYGVDALEEFVCVQNIPTFSCGSIRLLEPVSSASSISLSLNATPPIRLLLDGVGAVLFASGRECCLENSTDASDTGINITDVSNVVIGDIIFIGREAMKVTSIDIPDKELQVIRGFLGTTAVAHYSVDLYELPVIWRSIPVIIGSRIEIWSHDTEGVVATGQVETITTSDNATLELGIDSSFYKFNQAVDTAFALAEEMSWVIKQDAIAGWMRIDGPEMFVLESQEPPIQLEVDFLMLLVGKGRSVVVNGYATDGGYLGGKKVIRVIQTSNNFTDSYLTYVEGEGWADRMLDEFKGSYIAHRFSYVTEGVDCTPAGIVSALLTGTSSWGYPPLPTIHAPVPDVTHLNHLSSNLSNYQGFFFFPPSSVGESFLTYMKEKILRPLALGMIVHPSGEVSLIDWCSGIQATAISVMDLGSDQYTSSRNLEETLAIVELSKTSTLKSRRNRAYYGSTGRVVKITEHGYKASNVRERWLSAMSQYEMAQRFIRFTLASDDPLNSWRVGDLLDVLIPMFPQKDGTVGVSEEIRMRLLSVEVDFSSSEVQVEGVVVTKRKNAVWSGAVAVDGNQASTVTITVAEGLFTADNSDTEGLVGNSGVNGRLLLSDASLTPRSNNSPYLISAPTSTSVVISETFKYGATPLTLNDGDIILLRQSNAQPVGFEGWDIVWFCTAEGSMSGFPGGMYV